MFTRLADSRIRVSGEQVFGELGHWRRLRDCLVDVLSWSSLKKPVAVAGSSVTSSHVRRDCSAAPLPNPIAGAIFNYSLLMYLYGSTVFGTVAWAAEQTFLGLARSEWTSVLAIIAAGIVVLVIAGLLTRRSRFWGDLVRDIGIAFIVAGVVSGLYEFSTRSVEETRSDLDAVNHLMSLFIPKPVWNEISNEVVHRPAIRKNVVINVDVSHKAPPVTGQSVSLPPGQSVMWMKYSYDLYGLEGRPVTVSVDHTLDYHPMWNKDLRLPRFDKVVVTGPNTSQSYVGEAQLNRIRIGDDSITVKVQLQPLASGKPVHVETERHELVNTPGTYYLVMRELTVNDDENQTPALDIFVTVPPDLEVDVRTFYEAHVFEHEEGKNRWTFKGTMLPGQSVGFLFALRGKARLSK
jgi:hypothetical protein